MADDFAGKVWALRKHKRARTVLKAASVVSGAFLSLAGVVGLTGILQGDIVYFVGSLYAIFFGFLVLVLEMRDKVTAFSAAYYTVDVYLKFMTFQRGKGMFYWGVGLLILYIGPVGTSAWGLNNVAALCLAIVGALHTFKIVRESDPVLGPGADTETGSTDFRMPPAPQTPASTWSSMVNESSVN